MENYSANPGKRLIRNVDGVDYLAEVRKAMGKLADAGIDVEYMYAFANGDQAAAVMKCSDPEGAIEILTKGGFQVYQEKDVYLKQVGKE